MPRVWQGKGRIWLLLGIAVGIAVGVGKLAYFAGAATSLSDTAERIVGTGGRTLVHAAASHGASLRVVDGITAVLTVLVPGVTALLLMYAARGTLRLRALTGVLVAALGVAAFFYLPHGVAAGVAVLAFAAAGIALAATGPLVAAPLAALAALIATCVPSSDPREPQHTSQRPCQRLARGAVRGTRLAAVAASRCAGACRAPLRSCRALSSCADRAVPEPDTAAPVGSEVASTVLPSFEGGSNPSRSQVRRAWSSGESGTGGPAWVRSRSGSGSPDGRLTASTTSRSSLRDARATPRTSTSPGRSTPSASSFP